MNSKTLDFLVIGAMRSGTTTLHELLRQHPDIVLPPGKEVPFFSNDDLYQKGLPRYLDKNFPKVKNGATWGTITPQYMYPPDEISVGKVAGRIKEDLPDVKLIAIIRHPVTRAFSHYNYARRHAYEDRSFDDAVEEILTRDETEENSQSNEYHRFGYLSRSMYGEQLKHYYELFNANQLLVLFTDELESNPQETLEKIYEFINVDPGFLPENIDNTFHKGGGKPKIKLLTPGGIGRSKSIRLLWRKLLPYSLRKRFEIWLHVWNVKQDNTEVNKNSKTYQKLVPYFDKDIKKLTSLIGRDTPWSDWK